MIESLKLRALIVFAVIAMAAIWVTPNFVDFGEDDWWFTKNEIVYGLDIQGGLHLVMGVDVQGVIEEKISRLARSLENEFKDEGIEIDKVTLEGRKKRTIQVDVKTAQAAQQVKSYIEDYYPTTLQIVDGNDNFVAMRYYDSTVDRYKEQVVNQAIEVIRNRIDEFGVSEPNIAAQGDDRILVQLPGIENAAEAKDLINRTAKLTFNIVSEEIPQPELQQMLQKAEEEGGYSLKDEELSYSEYLKKLNEDLREELPESTRVVFQKPENAKTLEAGKIPFLVSTTTDLSGNELEDARVGSGEFGEPIVSFSFNPDGRRKFSQITEDNVNRRMAIVLDGVVQSAPTIQGKISSSSAQITLGQTNFQEARQEAQFIATALRAGALPAALTKLEERTVGPTLGADAIAAGKKAGFVAALLVVLFMLIYYRRLGLVADVALGLNILLILAILTSLEATLTLPGVAGIVLTVGMAVDANVIIFERVKEELQKGAGIRSAIKDGFGNAFSAIFDANITTAAVCVVLMYFGTGPVRGFAVTLICGIVTSMFTAIFVSRTILDFLVQRVGVKKLFSV